MNRWTVLKFTVGRSIDSAFRAIQFADQFYMLLGQLLAEDGVIFRVIKVVIPLLRLLISPTAKRNLEETQQKKQEIKQVLMVK